MFRCIQELTKSDPDIDALLPSNFKHQKYRPVDSWGAYKFLNLSDNLHSIKKAPNRDYLYRANLRASWEKVSLQSELGKGPTFIFSIPLIQVWVCVSSKALLKHLIFSRPHKELAEFALGGKTQESLNRFKSSKKYAAVSSVNTTFSRNRLD